jgi:heme/copper-type cytochrome/quinol oxidase subunit 2
MMVIFMVVIFIVVIFMMVILMVRHYHDGNTWMMKDVITDTTNKRSPEWALTSTARDN